MPRSSPAINPLRRRVVQVMDTFRPAMQTDGGDYELVDVGDDGIVPHPAPGHCAGCPSSEGTLKEVEQSLREQIPEVTQLVCVP